ncbi:protein kinase domain-containing protein [Streptomyces antibioticus]|uniref:serine/threonine-protein kinase n=1 Tax=Streptomyces antibioticus TaxID=1890 RepID=UPI003D760C23
MGRVWRASDEMLDRPVAVKEMRIDGLDPEDTRTRRERALREARATARIDHPQVVRVYDVVDAGERLWIVMELVAGRSLERVLVEDGRLGPQETARIGLGLVAALRQVHARGVLHRDIKPGNVLVEEAGESGDGRVVLTDFGIAAIQDTKALTMVGMLVGSPDYMAPERIAGRPQGPPSDNWSLGATLCATLAGHSPFSRDTTLATLHAVLYDEPVLPPEAGPLRPILTALLEKEPTLRASLSDVERALRPVAYPPPPPAWPVTDSSLSPGPAAGGRHAPTGEAGPLPGADTPDPRASRGPTTPHTPSEPRPPGGPATRPAREGAPEPGGTVPSAEAGPPPPGMAPGAAASDSRGSGGSLAPPAPEGVPAAEAGQSPGSAPGAGAAAGGSGGSVTLPAAEGRSRAGSGPASPGQVPGDSGGSPVPPVRDGVPAAVPGPPPPGMAPGAAASDPRGSGGSLAPPAPEGVPAAEAGQSPGSAPGADVGAVGSGGSDTPPVAEGRRVRDGSGPASPGQVPGGSGGSPAPPAREGVPAAEGGPPPPGPVGAGPRTSGSPLTPPVRRDGASSPGLPPGAGVGTGPRSSEGSPDQSARGSGAGVGGPGEAANPPVPEARSHVDSGPGAATRDSRGLSGREGAPTSLARAAAETERRPVPGGGSATPADRTRRRSVIAAATGVVAVGAVVGGILVFVPGGEGRQAVDTPPSGTASTATTPAPTVQGTSRPRSLPPGARVEAGGFAWVTPRGWQRDVKTGAEVHYTSPDGTQELVAKSSLARGDLMDTWETSEHNAHQGQDYVKIRLEETTFRGRPAVVWEYTFTLRGTPWHARLLGFDERGKSYQINTWYQPGVEGDALRTYERVKDGFTVL